MPFCIRGEAMVSEKPIYYGIIHVGSTSMTISIVEYAGIDEVRQIEYASREVNFGEELFQHNRLSFETINELCRILVGFKALLIEYDVKDYKVYATSVIREATNRRTILDQIFVRTGMLVEVIDMPKEIYYKYFALYHNLMKQGMTDMEEAMLFVDITSGGLGLTIWQGGSLLYQQNVHIGSLRVMETFNRNQRSSTEFPTAISEYLYSMLSPIVKELYQFNVKYMVLSGEEARIVARIMGSSIAHNMVVIDPAQFGRFVEEFGGLTATKLMNRFHLTEHMANILMPTIILYNEILNLVTVEKIFIMGTTFVEGITMYYGADKENDPYLHMMRAHNLQLAHSIAQRYHYDVMHIRQIEDLGLTLYDVLQRRSGLPARARYLYRMASILHGIGKHINLRNHAVQSYHIIMGTDIFGLSEGEKQVVANVAYYHYKGIPNDEDENFVGLSELQKILVIKLVAIIRLAQALDRSHLQKISTIDARIRDNKLIVEVVAEKDISLERWSFEKEAEYFREVFGMEAVLVHRR